MRRARPPRVPAASRSGLLRSDQPGLVGEDDCLDPVAEAELAEQAGDVAFDGGFADEQPLGELGVGQARWRVAAGLRFPGRSVPIVRAGVVACRAGSALGELGEQAAGHRGRQQGVAGGDHPDGLDQLRGPGVFEQEPAGSGLDRSVDVLVRRRRWSARGCGRGCRLATIWRVASIPSRLGIRTSIKITSGSVCRARLYGLQAVLGLAGHLQVRAGLRGSCGIRCGPGPGRRRSGRGWS